MVAIMPVIAIYDLTVKDEVADATDIQAWLDTIIFDTVLGWKVTPLGNSRFRYTITYEEGAGP